MLGICERPLAFGRISFDMTSVRKKRCDIRVTNSTPPSVFAAGDLVVLRKGSTIIPVKLSPRRIGNGQTIDDGRWHTTMERPCVIIAQSKEVAMYVADFCAFGRIARNYIVIFYQENCWAIDTKFLTRKIVYKEV